MVSVEDIGRSATVVGLTGRPLGTVVTLVGVVCDSGRPKAPRPPDLLVQQIDGRPPDHDVRVHLDVGTLDSAGPGTGPVYSVGHTYRLVGYESGGFTGEPDEAMKVHRHRNGAPDLDVQYWGFGFDCTFHLAYGTEPEQVASVVRNSAVVRTVTPPAGSR